jgi:uncharacterized protein YsxB (DUF464 family)
MINVIIRRNDCNTIIGYEASGHTDTAISCAAVSMVTQFPLVGAERILKLPVKHETDDNKGLLKVQFLQPYNDELEVLLKTMLVCLKMLKEKGVDINIKHIRR